MTQAAYTGSAWDRSPDRTGLPGGAVERRHIKTLTLGAVAALVVLNIADVVSTRLLLDHKVAMEANPLAGLLLSHGGLLWAKLVVIAALGYSVMRRSPRVGVMVVTWIVVGMYAAAVLSNLLILHLVSTLR